MNYTAVFTYKVFSYFFQNLNHLCFRYFVLTEMHVLNTETEFLVPIISNRYTSTSRNRYDLFSTAMMKMFPVLIVMFDVGFNLSFF